MLVTVVSHQRIVRKSRFGLRGNREGNASYLNRYACCKVVSPAERTPELKSSLDSLCLLRTRVGSRTPGEGCKLRSGPGIWEWGPLVGLSPGTTQAGLPGGGRGQAGTQKQRRVPEERAVQSGEQREPFMTRPCVRLRSTWFGVADGVLPWEHVRGTTGSLLKCPGVWGSGSVI